MSSDREIKKANVKERIDDYIKQWSKSYPKLAEAVKNDSALLEFLYSRTPSGIPMSRVMQYVQEHFGKDKFNELTKPTEKRSMLSSLKHKLKPATDSSLEKS